MKEALLYGKLDHDRVCCDLCAHRFVIKPGKLLEAGYEATPEQIVKDAQQQGCISIADRKRNRTEGRNQICVCRECAIRDGHEYILSPERRNVDRGNEFRDHKKQNRQRTMSEMWN